jgi:hypothetical protein
MSDTRSEAPATRRAPGRPAWVLAGLYLFGIGFGFVEAAVVVDLRAILTPVVARIAGHSSEDRFPMIPFDRIAKEEPAATRLMRVEVVREAATMILLAGVGLAAGRSFVGRFSAFVVGFGVWDLTYYLSLRMLTGWPASVWTWDVLFLIPVPWAAPVLAPAIVAATMVLAGSIAIVEEAAGRPFRVSRWEWLAIVAGGLILVASFCWDWQNIDAGGLPNPFPWPLFSVGEILGLGGFVHAWRTVRSDVAGPRPDSRKHGKNEQFHAETQRNAETQRRAMAEAPRFEHWPRQPQGLDRES